MKKLLLSLAGLMAAGLIGLEAYIFFAPHPPPQQHITQAMLPRGKPPATAPAFTLTDLSGHRRSLSDWHGKVVLVNFWAPWCAPCRKEMPLLVRMQRRYASAGFQVLGLAVDQHAPVKRYIAKHPVNYPVFPDQKAATRLSRAYGDDIGALPYSVLIGRDGRVIDSQAGRLDPVTLHHWLDKALQSQH